MKYNPNFDVDAVLDVLKGINGKYQEGSSEDEAIRVAAVALLYVRTAQKLEDYREFFRKFYTPAVESVLVSQSFATREEADEWLVRGKPRDGDLVRVAGEGFQVIPQRDGKGFRFLRTPLPEELMKKNSK
ncbi:hypothetical protein POL68_21680 [Stigmatella sp. ncwal1]|uniref:Head-to-tail adaptor n=1 Tax=Stigmatella ashevillensis TaxID=2995309 RepID=A0ABT5DBQ7_9BACT|nr:hypothetical protein [Stigmatella ashevillena]MDC0711097.1 hypothetical protein [Stigmatella ashevillena]